MTADRLALAAIKLREYRYDRIGFCRKILSFEPHPGQQKWFRARTDSSMWHVDPKTEKPVKPSEYALVSGNRFGKSFIAAADIIHDCVFLSGWDDVTIARMRKANQLFQAVNVSITADQANLVWYKAHAMLQNPAASFLVKDIKLTPFPSIIFITGAVFQARSTAGNGHHLLGHDYDRVNWDEAAFESKFIEIRDNVLRMRLVDRRGKLTYTSTPHGRNEFGQYMLDGFSGKEKKLYAQVGSSRDNPNISQESVEENAARMSDKLRLQNIEGAIVDSGDFFDAQDLAYAVDTRFDPGGDLNDMLIVHAVDNEGIAALAELFPDAARETPWRRRYPSHRYVTFWDLADKADWTVGTTWDISTRPRTTLVEFERFHKKGWEFIYSRIRDRHSRYPNHKTGIDATGAGDPAYDRLQDIVEEENAIVFSASKKPALLENWQQLINLRQVRWPHIGPFVEEHGYYRIDDKNLVQDCVMSGAGAAWMMRRGTALPMPASVLR